MRMGTKTRRMNSLTGCLKAPGHHCARAEGIYLTFWVQCVSHFAEKNGFRSSFLGFIGKK